MNGRKQHLLCYHCVNITQCSRCCFRTFPPSWVHFLTSLQPKRMSLSLNPISCSRSSHILVCFISNLWLSCEVFLSFLQVQIAFLFPYWKEELCTLFIHLQQERHSVLSLEYVFLGPSDRLGSCGDTYLPALLHLGLVLHWTFSCLLSCIPCLHRSWFLPLFCWHTSIHLHKDFLLSNLGHFLGFPFWKI